MAEFKLEPDVFNDENKAMFSVAELRDFANEFGKRCQKQSEGDLTGFWDLCKEKYYDRFKENKTDN